MTKKLKSSFLQFLLLQKKIKNTHSLLVENLQNNIFDLVKFFIIL